MMVYTFIYIKTLQPPAASSSSPPGNTKFNNPGHGEPSLNLPMETMGNRLYVYFVVVPLLCSIVLEHMWRASYIARGFARYEWTIGDDRLRSL